LLVVNTTVVLADYGSASVGQLETIFAVHYEPIVAQIANHQRKRIFGVVHGAVST
jgi:hypothetical protein